MPVLLQIVFQLFHFLSASTDRFSTFSLFHFFQKKILFVNSTQSASTDLHIIFQLFHFSQENLPFVNSTINYKNSDFCKLLRLCAISALQISKKQFATFDLFVRMKLVSTVVCTLNATTLIWLVGLHSVSILTIFIS